MDAQLHPSSSRAERRGPSLFEMAWQIRQKGVLQFFVDQWRDQGDLTELRMGRRRLLLVSHPEHVREVLVARKPEFEKLQTWEATRQLLLGDGLRPERSGRSSTAATP